MRRAASHGLGVKLLGTEAATDTGSQAKLNEGTNDNVGHQWYTRSLFTPCHLYGEGAGSFCPIEFPTFWILLIASM